MKKLKIEDISHQGYGVAFDDGKAHFVWDALPGEVVTVTITEDKKRFAIAKVIEREGESADRVKGLEPKPYAPFMHIRDETRKQVLQKSLQRTLGLKKMPVMHQSSESMYYRNKAQIPVREGYFGDLSLGYHPKGFDSFVAANHFGIYDKRIETILPKIEEVIRKHSISVYEPSKKEGILRHVICRQGFYLDQMLIIFVTNTKETLPSSFVKDIVSLNEHIVGIVQNIQDDGSSLILGDESIVLWGHDYYEDKLLGRLFPIQATSFYQVNPYMTEKLYQRAFELAELDKSDHVLDAYAGISTIGLSLAEKVKSVTSIEIDDEAVSKAKFIARRDGIENINILCGDVNSHLASLDDHVDVLFVDPPRRGLSDDFKKQLLKSSIEKIVYISCHPQSLARDLKTLSTNYELEHLEAFDMFPKTEHVETLALLQKRLNK